METVRAGGATQAATAQNAQPGGDEDIVHLWDVPSRKVLAVLREKNATDSRIISLAFSPDGKDLLRQGPKFPERVKLFDVYFRKLSRVVPFKESDVHAVAFSPDGKTLAAGGMASPDSVVVLFDVAERKEVARLADPGGYVKALTFTRDGKTLVTGISSKILLWDLEHRKVRMTLEGHSNQVSCVAVTPDGKTIISGSKDRTLQHQRDICGTGKEMIKPLTPARYHQHDLA